MKTKILFYFFILLFVAACKPEIDEFSPSKGNADFTKYVAIGNSLTAGYQDGDLYKTGQEYSLANILATQFKYVGAGEFKQPLMVDDAGFGTRRVLGISTDCLGVPSLGPVLAGAANPQNFASIYASQGPFNNFGVPGTKSFFAVTQGYGQANPYFGRFMSSPATSLLEDAMAAQPTFFTIWFGGNDILQYAVSGGETGGDSITSEAVFNQAMMGVVGGMLSTGGKGAIANIPDITTIPYFNTIPSKALVLTTEQATQLNAGYVAYNAGAQQLGVPQITFSAGPNYWVIQDMSSPYNALGGLRQIKAGELVLLTTPQDSLKCAHWGSQKPIPDHFILDKKEIDKIKAATVTFNEIIKGLATENDLAFVDANTYFAGFQSGMVFDGMKFNTTFVTGGLYSLDGVHPNPRGNAIVANLFIDAINTHFGAKIPMVNVGDYPGVKFP